MYSWTDGEGYERPAKFQNVITKIRMQDPIDITTFSDTQPATPCKQVINAVLGKEWCYYLPYGNRVACDDPGEDSALFRLVVTVQSTTWE